MNHGLNYCHRCGEATASADTAFRLPSASAGPARYRTACVRCGRRYLFRGVANVGEFAKRLDRSVWAVSWVFSGIFALAALSQAWPREASMAWAACLLLIALIHFRLRPRNPGMRRSVLSTWRAPLISGAAALWVAAFVFIGGDKRPPAVAVSERTTAARPRGLRSSVTEARKTPRTAAPESRIELEDRQRSRLVRLLKDKWAEKRMALEDEDYHRLLQLEQEYLQLAERYGKQYGEAAWRGLREELALDETG